MQESPLLPCIRAADLEEEATELPWLVEGLWSQEAVGILGGEPKCCKSFLALELAVATASGLPCLGRFAVPNPGRVLLYAAEDSHPTVKRRLLGICAARGTVLADLDIHVITAPCVRLDLAADTASLDATIEYITPRLLILDPFIRLHRIDENSSGEVASVLGNLRRMQRRYNVAVLVVHHAKKSGNHGGRAGQALRGSSEFHAWGDSNLYMRRSGGEKLALTVEHRAASSLGTITLELVEDGHRLALEIQKPLVTSSPGALDRQDPTARIEEALSGSNPIALAALRDICGMRTATLCQTLKRMIEERRVIRSSNGYRLNTP